MTTIMDYSQKNSQILGKGHRFLGAVPAGQSGMLQMQKALRLGPILFEAVHGGAGAGQLLRDAGRVGAGFFF